MSVCVVVAGSSHFHSLCRFQHMYNGLESVLRRPFVRSQLDCHPRILASCIWFLGAEETGRAVTSHQNSRLVLTRVCWSASPSTGNARGEHQTISIGYKWRSSNMACLGYFLGSEISRSSIYVATPKMTIKQRQSRAAFFDQCVVRCAVALIRVLSEGASWCFSRWKMQGFGGGMLLQAKCWRKWIVNVPAVSCLLHTSWASRQPFPAERNNKREGDRSSCSQLRWTCELCMLMDIFYLLGGSKLKRHLEALPNSSSHTVETLGLMDKKAVTELGFVANKAVRLSCNYPN